MDGTDFNHQALVTHTPVHSRLGGLVQRLAPQAFKVATGADAQDFTGQRDGLAGLEAGYPGVLHRDSLAKYAVAFF